MIIWKICISLSDLLTSRSTYAVTLARFSSFLPASFLPSFLPSLPPSLSLSFFLSFFHSWVIYPFIYSWPLNNPGIRGANTLCSWKFMCGFTVGPGIHNLITVESMVLTRCISRSTIVFIYWKQSAYRCNSNPCCSTINCIHHIFFIHSSVNGHLGCLCLCYYK